MRILGIMDVCSKLVIVTLINVFSLSSFAARVSIFDSDGTLFMDREQVGPDGGIIAPAWVTYWELQLVDPTPSGATRFEALKEQGLLPKSIFVSRSERDRLLKAGYLASGDGITGNPGPFKLDYDPVLDLALQAYGPYGFDRKQEQVVYPGYYSETKSPTQTFRFHRDEGFSRSPYPIDLEIGYHRWLANQNRSRLAGKAMKYLNHALTTLGNDDMIYVLTDRVHTQESCFGMLVLAQSFGLISKSIPVDKLKRVKCVFMNEHVNRTMYGGKKSNFLIDLISKLDASGVPKHQVISDRLDHAESGKTFMGHEVIMYENDPSYIQQIVRKVGGQMGYYRNTKFLLYHAGEEEQVRSSMLNMGLQRNEHPQRMVVFTPQLGGGSSRPLIDAERALYLPLNCSGALDLDTPERVRD